MGKKLKVAREGKDYSHLSIEHNKEGNRNKCPQKYSQVSCEGTYVRYDDEINYYFLFRCYLRRKPLRKLASWLIRPIKRNRHIYETNTKRGGVVGVVYEII